MTYHDLADIIVLVACFFWTWREIVRRWKLFIIWGWRGHLAWRKGFTYWRAYRLTGIIPEGDIRDFSMKNHVEIHGRATLIWTLFGSSGR